VPVPQPGQVLLQDDFAGTALDPAWQWVREDPAATVGGGTLNWPTEPADLVGTANDAGVLLRDAPADDYLVETKVTLDLGLDAVRNFRAGRTAAPGPGRHLDAASRADPADRARLARRERPAVTAAFDYVRVSTLR
jgi:hypothetical protein